MAKLITEQNGLENLQNLEQAKESIGLCRLEWWERNLLILLR